MNPLANLTKLSLDPFSWEKLKNVTTKKNQEFTLMEEQTGGKKLTPIPSNDNLELVPISSTSKNFIELNFPDIKVAQCAYEEGPVGLTWIQFAKGARMYKEKRGGWIGLLKMVDYVPSLIIHIFLEPLNQPVLAILNLVAPFMVPNLYLTQM